jgi:uncharacterized membrane protein YoaK (UPF0700 family)
MFCRYHSPDPSRHYVCVDGSALFKKAPGLPPGEVMLVKPLTKWWVTWFGGNWLLPSVLSAIAGAVDITGFLALGGLFTAQITGNLVIVAAHFLTGGFTRYGPLLAVPVFIAVLAVVTLACGAMEKAGYKSLRVLLVLQLALLAGYLGIGVGLGPFTNADWPMAVLAGMLGVAAMATQNVLVRLALKDAPSTAVMTTNITQLTLDLVTLAQRRGGPEELAKARHRASVTFPCVVWFVLGCAAGAGLQVKFGLWALALPVVLAALAVPLGEVRVAAMPHSGQSGHQK